MNRRVVRFTRSGQVLPCSSLAAAGLWALSTLGGAWELESEPERETVVREMNGVGKVRRVEGGRWQFLPPDAVTIRWGRSGAPQFAMAGLMARGGGFDQERAAGSARPRVAVAVQEKAAPGRALTSPAPSPVLAMGVLNVRVGQVMSAPVAVPGVHGCAVPGPVRPLVVQVPLQPVVIPGGVPALTTAARAEERPKLTGLRAARAAKRPAGAAEAKPAGLPTDGLPFVLPPGAALTWLAPAGGNAGEVSARVRLASGFNVELYDLERAQGVLDQAERLSAARRRSV